MNIKNISHNNIYYSYLFILFFVLLFFIAGFRPVGLDRDSENYARAVQSFIITHNYNFITIEPSFYLIVNVSKFLFDDVVRGVFILYALLGVSLTLYAIKKNSSFPLLSLIVYSSFYFVLHGMTQIRAGVAGAIFLLAIPDIVNRNLKSFLIKTALATLFHYVAIIMLFIYLINSKHNKQLFYLFLPLIGILCAITNVGRFFLMSIINFLPEFLSYKINIYLALHEMGIFTEINVFNLYYSSLLIIYYFAIININKFKKEIDVLQIKILGWMLFTFYSFYFLPVFAFRISEFLGLVLIFILPDLISIVREKYFISFVVFLYSIVALFNYIFVQKLLHF